MIKHSEEFKREAVRIALISGLRGKRAEPPHEIRTCHSFLEVSVAISYTISANSARTWSRIMPVT